MRDLVIFNEACANALRLHGREDVLQLEEGYLLGSSEPLNHEQAEAYCEAGGWIEDECRVKDGPDRGFWWRAINGVWLCQAPWSRFEWTLVDNVAGNAFMPDGRCFLVQNPEHLNET